jgi:hypothetical protein
MRTRSIVGFFLAALVFAAGIGRAQAASQFIETVQSHLYAGETTAAAEAAEAALAAGPADDEARFALGAVEFLQAIEHLGQAFHRYGLNNGESVGGLTGLPFFRLPVPPNPNPEKIDYDALRGVLAALVDDLGKAEATLSGVKSTTLDLPLDIGRIRLDLDGDGKGSEQESLGSILAALGGSEMSGAGAAAPLLVDFDASDVPGFAPTATFSWRSRSSRLRMIGEPPSNRHFKGFSRAPGCR